MKENVKNITEMFNSCNAKVSFKEFRDRLSKIALISSSVIFHAKG